MLPYRDRKVTIANITDIILKYFMAFSIGVAREIRIENKRRM